jgi:phage tail tape-measure protein
MKQKTSATPAAKTDAPLHLGKTVAGGATGAVVGAMMGGPIGAILGGAVGTAIGSAVESSAPAASGKKTEPARATPAKQRAIAPKTSVKKSPARVKTKSHPVKPAKKSSASRKPAAKNSGGGKKIGKKK